MPFHELNSLRVLQLCMKDMVCKCQDAANNTFSCIRRISPDFNNIFCVFEDDQVHRFDPA